MVSTVSQARGTIYVARPGLVGHAGAYLDSVGSGQPISRYGDVLTGPRPAPEIDKPPAAGAVNLLDM